MKIQYVQKRFRADLLDRIEQANKIIAEYTKAGYDLTLRQLYYQFVARGLIENDDKNYKNLGALINDARLAGLVSWKALVDRTRNLEQNSHWSSPSDIIEACVQSYQIEKWNDQPNYVEVWVEKEALAGVVERVARRLDVPYFSCRGYTSQSEMWAAGIRLKRKRENDQRPVIIHLGDHDPSGIDMTRDIEDRLRLFSEDEVEVNRIALNMNQIRLFNPPPNPAKVTDSRAADYISKFGEESWELDALDPKTLDALIEKTVLSYRDEKIWKKTVAKENDHKTRLEDIAQEESERESDE